MKKSTIILFFALATFALTFSTGQAAAGDEYLFKYSNSQTDTHPRSISMYFFKDLVEQASGGKIKVELYTAGVLGKEAEVLDMVKTGALQGCRGGLFERANKMYLLYTLPFFFDNTDQVLKLMRGDFGKKVNQDALKNGFLHPRMRGCRRISQHHQQYPAHHQPDGFKGAQNEDPAH